MFKRLHRAATKPGIMTLLTPLIVCAAFIPLSEATITWKQLAPKTSPSLRASMAMAFDLLLISPVLAQVTIRNPDRLDVPEQRVEILFRTTCRVVALEFNLREREVDFPLVLVLGDPNERYASDEEHQLYTIYLYRWDEAQFAISTMRLAIQHMVTRSRRDRLLREILKRANGIDTISTKSLRGQHR